MSSTEQRHLAAIMFTDLVGYSALTQRNEKLALELLEEHRRLFRELFPKFEGREVETTGDGFLVEFGSSLAAARCAIEMQRAISTRNLSAAPDRQIQVRIGIHVGDVVHKDGHVLGDGVNIAARLQPLAEPGGICISEDVARQIQHNLEAVVVSIGQAALKNIRLPVKVCRIVLPWEKQEAARSAEVQQPEKPMAPRSQWKWALALLAIVSIAIAGGGVWWTKQRFGVFERRPERRANHCFDAGAGLARARPDFLFRVQGQNRRYSKDWPTPPCRQRPGRECEPIGQQTSHHRAAYQGGRWLPSLGHQL
jgi:class 3 adenylate cyclase